MKQLSKLIILFSIVLTVGCKKKDPEKVPPVITFMDANLSSDKTSSIVRFEFFDGDGDLGLHQDENLGEQEFNLFVEYYEKINGVWTLKTPIIDSNFNTLVTPPAWEYDTTYLHARIPFIKNESERALEGETQVNLLYNFNADTFRYEIRLKDRAFHMSNVIITTELIVD